jgi:hypothetical protein
MLNFWILKNKQLETFLLDLCTNLEVEIQGSKTAGASQSTLIA